MLKSELELVKIFLYNTKLSSQKPLIPHIGWRAKISDLVELVYALYHIGCFGDVKLKDVFLTFEQMSGIEAIHFSHVFGRMRIRKGDRCTFLRMLKENLEKVMEEYDG